MTKAQAAAARHEETANSIDRKKAKEDNQYMNEVRRRAQKKASKSTVAMVLIPIVVAVIVIALAFWIVPNLGNVIGG